MVGGRVATTIIDPHSRPKLSLNALIGSAWKHRSLIYQMSRRDVLGRYRGSMGGIAWSFLNPLIMLLVYTFVFSVVFKARWPGPGPGSKSAFAIILFTGLIVLGLFSECVNRAPTLILSNINFVKKVVFPLEILPWIVLCSGLFHASVSIGMMLLAEWLVMGGIPWTVVLLPALALPLCLFTLGFTWMVAAIGVYMRDIGQLTLMFTTALMFLSPVFYSLSTLPEPYRGRLGMNPFALLIEHTRGILLLGSIPPVQDILALTAAGLLVAWAGFAWFQRARVGFADVL